MKKHFFNITFLLFFIIFVGFAFSGCGVVAVAYVYLDMPGYVWYSSSMFSGSESHIYYYENETVANDVNNAILRVDFIPRIMGYEEVDVNGEIKNATLVDLSNNYVDIKLAIKGNFYSNSKKFYVNNETIDPNQKTGNNESWYYLLFQNVSLQRGNPNGAMNGVVNKIEYK